MQIFHAIAVCLFYSISSFAQNGTYSFDETTGKITNYNAKYEFSHAANYDYDLQEFGPKINERCLVVIKINEHGAGELITFLQNKAFFTVVECKRTDKWLEFVLQNIDGVYIKAHLVYENNIISSFWLKPNNAKNTAVVFF